MKKFLSILMILALVLGMGISAMADEATGYSLTITGADGHSYDVYQVFLGDIHVEEDGSKVLSNVTYGANYTPGNAVAGVTKVPVADLEAIKDAKAFGEKLEDDELLEGDPVSSVTASGESVKIGGLVPGYYVVIDVTKDLPDGDTHSAIIVQIVGDATIASKHGTVTIEKKVDDENDSSEAEDGEDWIDSADYDIGDTVPFKSDSTFTDLTKYDSYEVTFTDIMSPGLTYDKNLKIYIGEAEVTEFFTINNAAYTTEDENEAAYNGGTIITATCDDIKEIPAVGTNDEITFTLRYSATLNDNAMLGAPGNPNKIKLKGNPDGRGEFETPWDVAIVFTYKLDVDKFKNEVKEGNELTGAGFTLYKWQIVTAATADAAAVYDWVAIGEEVKGEEMTNFVWKGIDDGKYKLVETTTPAGYNTIDPIYFTVTADHEVLSDNPALTELKASQSEAEMQSGSVAEFTANATEGSVATDVINKSGVVLPETGGMGTTLFYIFGGCLVLGAIVLMITKKRMKNAEE